MLQSKYRAELFTEAFDDSIPDSNNSNEEHPNQRLVKQNVMKPSCKSDVAINDSRHKPSPTTSNNLISGQQTAIQVNECLEKNMSKGNSSRFTKYPKRTNLANRSDVLNKCSIRKLRRHFWTLFRTKNK